MTLPSFSASLGAPSTTPMSALAEGHQPETPGVVIAATPSGFAAALDEATTTLDLPDGAAPDGAMPASPASTLPAAFPTTFPPLVAPGPVAPPVDAATDIARRAPGWPPPGLSSLFPSAALLGAEAAAPVASSPAAAGRGFSLAALRPEGPAGRAAEVASPSPAALLGLGTGATATHASPAPATPTAIAIAPDAWPAALARQLAPLHPPVVEDGDSAALTVLDETLPIDRTPDLLPALPASTAPGLHKLDLAQAFPAPVPLPSPRFAEEVGARLQWIAEQQGGEATLRISPDGLGPVEIRLKLDGDRVELGFTATQQDTRQALQDALPRLREMLAQQGLQLGHADVGQKHSQSSNEEAGKASAGRPQDDDGDAIVLSSPIHETNVVNGRVGIGVLDLYA